MKVRIVSVWHQVDKAAKAVWISVGAILGDRDKPSFGRALWLRLRGFFARIWAAYHPLKHPQKPPGIASGGPFRCGAATHPPARCSLFVTPLKRTYGAYFGGRKLTIAGVTINRTFFPLVIPAKLVTRDRVASAEPESHLVYVFK